MSNAERYLASLPLTRNEIVLSKYLLSLITTFIGAVVGDISSIIVQLITVGNLEQLSRSLSIGILGVFVMAIFNSIQIPCVLKNGAEKNRLAVFTIAGIITLICMAIYKF